MMQYSKAKQKSQTQLCIRSLFILLSFPINDFITPQSYLPTL